jgi:TFIIF-interacting CTD phosphatase-like protein
VDSISSIAQVSQNSKNQEEFPEDFDIKDELKLDKEVYKFTGE